MGRDGWCFWRRGEYGNFARVRDRCCGVMEFVSFAGVGGRSRHLRLVLRDLLRADAAAQGLRKSKALEREGWVVVAGGANPSGLGERLAYVKEQMGHSSIQVTVDVYGHLVPSGNRAALDRLDAAQPTATPAQPEAMAVNQGKRVSRLRRMVSQEGIEPSTRRLRVCCSAN